MTNMKNNSNNATISQHSDHQNGNNRQYHQQRMRQTSVESLLAKVDERTKSIKESTKVATTLMERSITSAMSNILHQRNATATTTETSILASKSIDEAIIEEESQLFTSSTSITSHEHANVSYISPPLATKLTTPQIPEAQTFNASSSQTTTHHHGTLSPTHSQNLTIEELELIAAPDNNQSKLVAEAKKRKEERSNTLKKAKEKVIGGLKTIQDVNSVYYFTDTLTCHNNPTSSGSFDGDDDDDMHDASMKLIQQGIIYKLRSGIGGKLSAQKWEKRKFELRGSQLKYYSLDNELRGTFSLKKDHYLKPSLSGQNSNAPTPFVITIVPRQASKEWRWKLCFTTKEELITWVNAILNVSIELSVQGYKGWNNADDEIEDFDESSDDDHPHHRRKSTAFGTSSSVSFPKSVKYTCVFISFWIWSNLSLFLYFLLVRTAETSLSKFLIFLYFFNSCAAAFFTAFSNVTIINLYSSALLDRQLQDKHLFTTQNEKIDQSQQEAKVVSEDEQHPLEPGSSTSPLHNHQDQAQDTQHTIPGLKQNQIKWSSTPPQNFKIRSHNYITSKQKIPSPGSLYELYAVDMFQTHARIKNFSYHLKLPLISDEIKQQKTWDWHCPEYFIIYLSIPTEAPSLGFTSVSSSSVDAGEGMMLICYYKMKSETREILKEKYELANENPMRNAVKLFNDWCYKSTIEKDAAFQGRFKLIPLSNNLEEIGVPNYMTKYNNKPLLIKRAGTTGILTPIKKDVLEMEINFYPFPYLGKQALSYLRSNYFSKMDVNLGFVIEGRQDDVELPEVLIGTVSIPKQDFDLMPKVRGYGRL